MKWKKLGVIFCPNENSGWMSSHASYPVVEKLEGGKQRVYFSSRDSHNRSSIGYFEFNVDDPRNIIRVTATPVLPPGETGLFDDSGASIGCLVSTNGKRYMYYMGWNLGITVPWRNSIGLAISDREGGHFRKYSKAPIMDRCDHDPFSLSYPWVLKDNNIWRIWYGSTLSWGRTKADAVHVIKYGESRDGIHWERTGVVSIGPELEGEYAFSRPCVLKEGDLYRMWYSYRGPAYRIGYAESADGFSWVRKDQEAGINVSLGGWDSEMIEYPVVFDNSGQRYMLYNGNGYGKTGIGLAVQASSDYYPP